ncbi:efflux RND transporter permease subunit, partial [Klebsiella pneumoniae]|uniref:efflux RND transporter permease subunit n=1 Tax=Klebsiella pneumoniae TaxID=573 RepID=UPI0038521A07
KIPIATIIGQTVMLEKVAKVTDSHQDVRIQTRLNGNPAVGIQIVKQSEANTVTTAAAVREKLAQIAKSYPELKFRLVYDQSGFIENSIDDL